MPLLILLLFLPYYCFAEMTAYRVATGTGFFVSKYGDIVTNAHVVKGCDTVDIRGAVPPNEAQVVAVDTAADLALLRAAVTPPRIAQLRENIEALARNDAVWLIGYPEMQGLQGDYTITESRLMDVTGPLGNAQWLQFRNAAKRGNSGGPLLDNSGNVVGVVTGKSTVIRHNHINGQDEAIRHADIAITLAYLKKFLEAQQVYYNQTPSHIPQDTDAIEVAARDYVVNIACRL